MLSFSTTNQSFHSNLQTWKIHTLQTFIKFNIQILISSNSIFRLFFLKENISINIIPKNIYNKLVTGQN